MSMIMTRYSCAGFPAAFIVSYRGVHIGVSYRVSFGDHRENLALDQHGPRKIGSPEGMPRRSGLLIRKHFQPSDVEIFAHGPVLQPDVHFHHVLRAAACDFEDLANRGEHPGALSLNSFRHFPRKRLLPRYSAGDQERSHLAGGRERIIVAEARYVDAYASAHIFSSLVN